MLIRVIVWKRSSAFPAFGEWANYYLVEWTQAGDATEELANAIIASEGGMHLQTVEFMRVVTHPMNIATPNMIGNEESEAPGKGNQTRIWFPLPAWRHGNQSPMGKGGDEQLCLFVRKQTQSGINGKAWYRGCLRTDEVNVTGDGIVRLLNGSDWDSLLAVVFGGYPENVSSFKVQHHGISRLALGDTEPVLRFIARGALFANAISRARSRIPAFRRSGKQIVDLTVEVAREGFQRARERVFLNNPHNGADIQTDLRRTLTYSLTACSTAKDLVQKNSEGECDAENAPATRTGPTNQEIIDAAGVTVTPSCGSNAPTEDYTQALQELDQVQPTHVLAGVPYWNPGAVQEMMDIVEPFLRAAEICGRGDFLISLPRGS